MGYASFMLARPFLSLTALLLLLALPAEAAEEVRVGVLAYRGAERAISDWTATFDSLGKALPQYAFQMVPGDLDQLTAAVAAHRLAFIITNPGHYVELETEYGAARIATTELQGGPPPALAVGATIFARAGEAGLRDLRDLRGKRLAAVAAETFGFRQAWREMLEQGIDPFSDLASLTFLGFPVDGVVEAVRRGDADAGVVRACVIEKMAEEGKVRPGEFRVIAGQTLPSPGCQVSTRLYPDWPFAKLPQTSEVLAKQVAQALLAMPSAADGQAWTVPVDYHAVHALYRALKIGPYAGLRQRSLSGLFWDNRHWLALLGLGLVWWVVHVLRVQYLVRKRTDELRAANEDARDRREALEHAVRLSLVGEMAGSLAHEINQPLAAIANYARGCERRLQNGGDAAQLLHGVRQIAAQAERGGEIVRRMRDFVRKRPPSPQRLDPRSVIDEALALFAALAARRGVVVQVEPFGPLPLPMIDADQVQLEEVLLNLLQNAVDAVDGQAQPWISVQLGSADGVVAFSVADNGPGLDEVAMGRLFEAFFTTKPQGLGLGLSLSRSIVEAHGGRLWVENRPAGGAVFHFTLPIAQEPADV